MDLAMCAALNSTLTLHGNHYGAGDTMAYLTYMYVYVYVHMYEKAAPSIHKALAP